MELRKRAQGDYWMNEAPITDSLEALHVLREEWNDTGYRYISLREEKPEIHLGWFNEGDSGGATSGVDYLEIDPAIAKKLRDEQWVEPRRIPHWGYTEVRQDQLVLSQWGKREMERLLEEAMTSVRAQLKPGTHSEKSDVFKDAGYGRDHGRWGGRLYFDFRTPVGEKVRMYADNGEFTQLEPEKISTPQPVPGA
ncbi:MAG TPA: hypothetical protein VG934_01725 [Candidatus Paceibacterota bacterium]|nr:hypothetical protein [Candidatus Paceibacterota bacterium]